MCDVDLNRMVEAKEKFPNARFYQDWRELLDKEDKNIDSVNVSTPDHMHAPIGVSAMQLGKTFMARSRWRRDLRGAPNDRNRAPRKRSSRRWASRFTPTFITAWRCGWCRTASSAKSRRFIRWCNKSWGDLTARPDQTDLVPDGFDWNLWLGVCAERPFIGGNYYHPTNWRKRLDFGTGTLGDMGCHIFDPVFESIGLTAPLTICSEGLPPNEWNWSPNGLVHYTFPGTHRTAEKTLPVTWY